MNDLTEAESSTAAGYDWLGRFVGLPSLLSTDRAVAAIELLGE
jgi:hypothetical protein